MSRSNPTADGISNPATRFFEWSGSTGKIKYYDKVEKQSYEVDLPFSFLVLDQLNTITGFNKRDQSGYWSNEVRNITTDAFTVKTKAGVKAENVLYNSKAMADILAYGGKYTKSVYIAYIDDGGKLVLGHLKLAGSAIGSWIEFTKANDVNKIAVVLNGATAAKNGTTDYFIPVFEARVVSPETDSKAKDIDAELQQYLNQYLISRRISAPQNASQEGLVDESDDEQEESQPVEATPVVKKTVEKGQIDIKSVPF